MFELKRRIAQYCADLVSSITPPQGLRYPAEAAGLGTAGVNCTLSPFLPKRRGAVVTVFDAQAGGVCS